MKNPIVVLLVYAGAVGGAELNGELLVSSNYVWRGISLSEDAPAVIGGFDYAHRKGWFASAQAASVRVDGNPEQQVVLRAGLSQPAGDWMYDIGVVDYEYVRGDRYNPEIGRLDPGTENEADFYEFFIGVSHGNGEFRYYRSEDYLASGKLSNYYELNYAAPMAEEAQWILHYGFTDSGAIIDHAAQLSDMAFGVAKGPFSVVVTNLDDNEDGLQSRNPRFVVAWHQTIPF